MIVPDNTNYQTIWRGRFLQIGPMLTKSRLTFEPIRATPTTPAIPGKTTIAYSFKLFGWDFWISK